MCPKHKVTHDFGSLFLSYLGYFEVSHYSLLVIILYLKTLKIIILVMSWLLLYFNQTSYMLPLAKKKGFRVGYVLNWLSTLCSVSYCAIPLKPFCQDTFIVKIKCGCFSLLSACNNTICSKKICLVGNYFYMRKR